MSLHTKMLTSSQIIILSADHLFNRQDDYDNDNDSRYNEPFSSERLTRLTEVFKIYCQWPKNKQM